jgi:enoyl-CoA hydratase
VDLGARRLLSTLPLAIGLVNRVVEDGRALEAALQIAEQLAAFPQAGMRSDRLSLIEQWGMSNADAIRNEIDRGLASISIGEMFGGAARFAEGEGRHGKS